MSEEEEKLEENANDIEVICQQYQLNRQQYEFCIGVVSGMFDGDAYVKAYWPDRMDVNKASARAAASRLRTSVPGVNEYITVMRAEIMKHQVLDIAEKRVLLAEIARGQASEECRGMLFEDLVPSHTERMKAIDLDNKMAGDYATEKSEVSLQGNFVSDLFSALGGTGFTVDKQLGVPEVQVQEVAAERQETVCRVNILDDETTEGTEEHGKENDDE